MSRRFKHLDPHQRVEGCKAALENIGWCWQSDLRQEECREIEEAWKREDAERRKMGLEVTEYGIRKARMDGLDIWEAYIV